PPATPEADRRSEAGSADAAHAAEGRSASSPRGERARRASIRAEGWWATPANPLPMRGYRPSRRRPHRDHAGASFERSTPDRGAPHSLRERNEGEAPRPG